jgi:hypothetical protein
MFLPFTNKPVKDDEDDATFLASPDTPEKDDEDDVGDNIPELVGDIVADLSLDCDLRDIVGDVSLDCDLQDIVGDASLDCDPRDIVCDVSLDCDPSLIFSPIWALTPRRALRSPGVPGPLELLSILLITIHFPLRTSIQ